MQNLKMDEKSTKVGANTAKSDKDTTEKTVLNYSEVQQTSLPKIRKSKTNRSKWMFPLKKNYDYRQPVSEESHVHSFINWTVKFVNTHDHNWQASFKMNQYPFSLIPQY